MSFLFPIYALGALAIIGPIIWHFTRNRPKTQVPFSATFFLSASPISSKEKKKFEHWILALVRILILMALSLAFMRPYLPGENADKASGQPLEAVWILVDTSASMQRDGYWPAAQTLARQVVSSLGTDTQAALWWFDHSPERAWDPKNGAQQDAGLFQTECLRLINEKAPGWNETRLDLALEQALEDATGFIDLAAAQNSDESVQPAANIIVISDFQSGLYLDNLNGLSWPETVRVTPRIIYPENETGRAALQSGFPFKKRPTPPSFSESVSDEARTSELNREVWEGGIQITSGSNSTVVDYTLRWEPFTNGNAGEPISSALEISSNSPLPMTLTLAPGEIRSLAIQIEAEPSTAIAGKFILESAVQNDSFPDNEFYLSLANPAPTSVCWISESKDDDARERLFFAEQAFLSMENAVDFSSLTWDEFRNLNQDPSNPRFSKTFWILDGFPSEMALENDFWNPLASRLKSGGAFCVILNHIRDIQAITALTGLSPTALSCELETRPTGYTLTDLDFTHPWLTPFRSPESSDFSKIRFFQRIAPDLTPLAEEVSIVATFEPGRPAWLDITTGTGHIAVLTSGFALNQSQFARSTKFVAFWDAVLRSSFPLQLPPTQIRSGEVFAFEKAMSSLGVIQENPLLFGPDGIEISPDMPAQRPGLYPVKLSGESNNNSSPLTALAVNLDPSEIQTEVLSMDDLKRYEVPIADSNDLRSDADELMSRALALAGKPSGTPRSDNPLSAPDVDRFSTRNEWQATVWEKQQSWWKVILATALGLVVLETMLAGYWTRTGKSGSNH